MMNEAKPFASLGPTLLARKGGARPAMRPQLSPLLSGAQQASDEDSPLDDLGWNDMGDPDEDDREKRVIPIGLSPIGATDDDEQDFDDEEFDAEPTAELAPEPVRESIPEPIPEPIHAAHVFAEEEPEEEEPEHREFGHGEPEIEALRASPLVRPAQPAPAPVANGAGEPDVLRQRHSLSTSFEEEPRPARRRAIDGGRRAAFTLRLDAQRHLKLRLASTIRNRSAQQLVTEALDQFLAEIPEIEALAARVTRD